MLRKLLIPIFLIILSVGLVTNHSTQSALANSRSEATDQSVQTGTLLYSQLGSTTQQLRSSIDTLTSAPVTQVADDFMVPTEGWVIESVVAYGTQGNGGALFNVTIFANAGGFPGATVCTRASQINTGLTDDPILNLSSPCILTAGHYWLSVQHLGTDNTGWFWSNTSLGTFNLPAVFEAPANLTGCVTTWTPANTNLGCTLVQNPPDRQFELYGTVGLPSQGQPSPQAGMISISTAEAQPVYESPTGNIVRDAGGNEIWLPQDYDGSGADTHLVMSSIDIDGRTWYEIWIGAAGSTVWVPADKVTVVE